MPESVTTSVVVASATASARASPPRLGLSIDARFGLLVDARIDACFCVRFRGGVDDRGVVGRLSATETSAPASNLASDTAIEARIGTRVSLSPVPPVPPVPPPSAEPALPAEPPLPAEPALPGLPAAEPPLPALPRSPQPAAASRTRRYLRRHPWRSIHRCQRGRWNRSSSLPLDPCRIAPQPPPLPVVASLSSPPQPTLPAL